MQSDFHVIVADDDQDDQIIIKDVISDLKKAHIKLTSVFNGRELIEKLRSLTRKPDLILLDINMPIMDGLQALTIIKADKDLSVIPISVISTMRSPEKIDQSKTLGLLSCHSKPSDMNSFKLMIEEILAKATVNRNFPL